MQTFRNNMKDKEEPVVSKAPTGKSDFTCVTFKPDLKRFKMSHLDDDIVALMSKRVYDMAGVSPRDLKVYLNKSRLPVRCFEEYVGLYKTTKAGEEAPFLFERVNDRWEVCVSLSEGQFTQVSFVNAICTTKGAVCLRLCLVILRGGEVLDVVSLNPRRPTRQLHRRPNHRGGDEARQQKEQGRHHQAVPREEPPGVVCELPH